jgi:hypothetical protein
LCNYLTIFSAFCPYYFIKISGKMENKCADNSDMKCRFHKLNTIETKLEIISCARNGQSLASTGHLADLCWLTVYSTVKEKNKIKDHV